MFHEIADVCEMASKGLPVFCDKHLSWDIDLARGVVERAEALGIALLSASSIPLSPYRPPVSVEDRTVRQAVTLCPLVDGGRVESYGYHAMEMLHQVIEHRRAGPAGILQARAWEGEAVWSAAAEGLIPLPLIEAAWQVAEPDRACPGAGGEAEAEFPSQAYRVDYADGLAVTHVGLGSFPHFSLALDAEGDTFASRTDAGGGSSERYGNFAALMRLVEDWMLDGVEPWPIERSLLTCGALQAMVQSRVLPAGTPLPTPHLSALSYTPSPHRVGVDHWSANTASS